MKSFDSLGPFECVIFDCDSTLTQVEGIDLLAGTKQKEISDLTQAAMCGKIDYQEIYKRRLEIVRPSFSATNQIGIEYIKHITPGAQDTVSALGLLNKRVIMISGGFRPALLMLARHLGLSGERVFGVDLFFDDQGHYQGYDELNRLTRNRGKIEMVRDLAGQGRRTVFIGDGNTDWEAGEAVDLFLGFGGVVRRAEVEKKSSYYITSNSLTTILPIILTPFEQKKLHNHPRFRAALQEGVQQLTAGGLIIHG